MEYTAVIRTLGKAGDKYQQLLDSLVAQTIRPAKIIVYIAEGYPLPKETVGVEEYVYVKKGMVAQRALPYDEVNTEYILFLDDDVYLPKDSVEKMYEYLAVNKADVISPDVFPNAERSLSGKLMMMISGRMLVNPEKRNVRSGKNEAYKKQEKRSVQKRIYAQHKQQSPK